MYDHNTKALTYETTWSVVVVLMLLLLTALGNAYVMLAVSLIGAAVAIAMFTYQRNSWVAATIGFASAVAMFLAIVMWT